MSIGKSPSLDGLSATFIRGTIGVEVTSVILKILNDGGPIDEINKTGIVLIPKKKEAIITTWVLAYKPM